MFPGFKDLKACLESNCLGLWDLHFQIDLNNTRISTVNLNNENFDPWSNSCHCQISSTYLSRHTQDHFGWSQWHLLDIFGQKGFADLHFDALWHLGDFEDVVEPLPIKISMKHLCFQIFKDVQSMPARSDVNDKSKPNRELERRDLVLGSQMFPARTCVWDL